MSAMDVDGECTWLPKGVPSGDRTQAPPCQPAPGDLPLPKRYMCLTPSEEQALYRLIDDQVDSENALHRLNSAKVKARSELDLHQWTKRKYAMDPDVAEFMDLQKVAAKDVTPRVHVNNIKPEQFAERFERTFTPTVIRGGIDDWKASETWHPYNLMQRVGDLRFKVGEDDDGDPVKLRCRYFLWYALNNPDDSPIYLFDGNFERRKRARDKENGTEEGPQGSQLRGDYHVPELFKNDLFCFAGERKRPPHRWFVMGPRRSGTNMHQDPLATSAWNSLVFGHKRWVLFPPGSPVHLVKPKQLAGDREGVTWFKNVYPTFFKPDYQGPKPIEILQRPGETMFVPGGWWHVVLNMDFTVAVTENFASAANFPLVWKRTLHSRPRLANKWLRVLSSRRPEVAAIARSIKAGTFDYAPWVLTEEKALKWLLEYESSSSSSSSTSSSEGDDNDVDLPHQELLKPIYYPWHNHSNSTQQGPPKAQGEVVKK